MYGVEPDGKAGEAGAEMSIYDRPAEEQLEALQVVVRMDRETADWLRQLTLVEWKSAPEAKAANEALKNAIGNYDYTHNALTRTVEAEAERKAKRAAYLANDVPVADASLRCEARVPDPKGWFASRCMKAATVTRPQFDDNEGSINLCSTHRRSENTGRYRGRHG